MLLTKNYSAVLLKYKNDPRNENMKMSKLKKDLKEHFQLIFPQYSEVYSIRSPKH